MKLPGLAWLELSVGQDYDGLTTYHQRAIFRPRGLAGRAYWRCISPVDGVVFGGMLRNITAAAEQAERAGDTPAPSSHALSRDAAPSQPSRQRQLLLWATAVAQVAAPERAAGSEPSAKARQGRGQPVRRR